MKIDINNTVALGTEPGDRGGCALNIPASGGWTRRELGNMPLAAAAGLQRVRLPSRLYLVTGEIDRGAILSDEQFTRSHVITLMITSLIGVGFGAGS
ncbi:hypothetical protein SK571_40550 [Lentzea sp. BCCO 10_0798]|uniref:Uncharacterized protein n=1 Tax=Lentzea kristufekii TaxID=3095430 RepID=A0ABU4U554_9PSEU|nr:hypothetical protein [Lentzea sp. BCCO 10_0798]MDX8055705.1 hypothetical protein [Lentzea sp. BCCO 10_0798]